MLSILIFYEKIKKVLSIKLYIGVFFPFFSQEYIEKIRELDDCVDEQLKSKADDYDSIYFSHVCNNIPCIYSYERRSFGGGT